MKDLPQKLSEKKYSQLNSGIIYVMVCIYYPILKMTQTQEYVDTWYNTGKDWQKNNKLSMLMELEIEE